MCSDKYTFLYYWFDLTRVPTRQFKYLDLEKWNVGTNSITPSYPPPSKEKKKKTLYNYCGNDQNYVYCNVMKQTIIMFIAIDKHVLDQLHFF